MRSQRGHKIHGAILGYIKANETTQKDVSEVLATCKDDLSPLIEKSINGYTHLLDIFHISYQNKTPLDKEIAKERSQFLFRELFKTIDESSVGLKIKDQVTRFLLLEKNDDGISALHEVFLGPEANIIEFLAFLKNACIKGILTKQEYVDLLVYKTQAGYTPLHQILLTGTSASVKEYLSLVKEANEKGILSDKDFIHLLTDKNHAGFTPFHEACLSGSVGSFLEYINTIQEVYDDKTLPEKECIQLLIAKNKAGYNALHILLMVGQPILIKTYMSLIEDSYRKNLLSKTEYLSWLKDENEAGYSPFYQALSSGKAEGVIEFFNAIRKIYETGILTETQFVEILTGKNKYGYNSLHSLLSSEIEGAFETYISIIKNEKLISAARYAELYTEVNKEGSTPLYCVLGSGKINELNAFLKEILSFYETGKIGKDEFLKYLTKPNNAGFTPLHQAAFCGNFSIVKTFIDFIQINFPKDASKLIAEMLRARTVKGYTPSCTKGKEATQINDYLKALAQKYGVNEYQQKQDRKRKELVYYGENANKTSVDPKRQKTHQPDDDHRREDLGYEYSRPKYSSNDYQYQRDLRERDDRRSYNPNKLFNSERKSEQSSRKDEYRPHPYKR